MSRIDLDTNVRCRIDVEGSADVTTHAGLYIIVFFSYFNYHPCEIEKVVAVRKKETVHWTADLLAPDHTLVDLYTLHG